MLLGEDNWLWVLAAVGEVLDAVGPSTVTVSEEHPLSISAHTTANEDMAIVAGFCVRRKRAGISFP